MADQLTHVRLSLAAAMTLGLRSGRTFRDARTGCVNLLLDYPTRCLANCAYCGLARGRAPAGEKASFIRVEWPLVDVAVVLDRLARRAAEVRRVCISMVENARAFEDARALCQQIRTVSDAPLSILIHPRGLDDECFRALANAGVDRIGIGLDAASPRVFERRRPGLEWALYRGAISTARRVFGPWKVNCHVVVGLGETDRDILALELSLLSEQVEPYLFCFYPEAGSRMARRRRPSLRRWRRVQLATYLLGRDLVRPEAIQLDARGGIEKFNCEPALLDRVLFSGKPFRTDGCPDAEGRLACNRPFGSYRPGQSFRDFPFEPGGDDVDRIRREAGIQPSGGQTGTPPHPARMRLEQPHVERLLTAARWRLTPTLI